MSYNRSGSWRGDVQQSNGSASTGRNVNFIAYPQLNRNSRHQEQHWNQAPSSNNNNSYQTSTNFEQFDNSASSFSRKQPYEGGGNDNNQPYVYNAIGTITQIADSGGLVNDEIVFYRSAVRGDMPLLGSRVLFEAVIHNDPDQPYKWIAKRIQLMTPRTGHKSFSSEQSSLTKWGGGEVNFGGRGGGGGNGAGGGFDGRGGRGGFVGGVGSQPSTTFFSDRKSKTDNSWSNDAPAPSNPTIMASYEKFMDTIGKTLNYVGDSLTDSLGLDQKEQEKLANAMRIMKKVSTIPQNEWTKKNKSSATWAKMILEKQHSAPEMHPKRINAKRIPNSIKPQNQPRLSQAAVIVPRNIQKQLKQQTQPKFGQAAAIIPKKLVKLQNQPKLSQSAVIVPKNIQKPIKPQNQPKLSQSATIVPRNVQKQIQPQNQPKLSPAAATVKKNIQIQPQKSSVITNQSLKSSPTPSLTKPASVGQINTSIDLRLGAGKRRQNALRSLKKINEIPKDEWTDKTKLSFEWATSILYGNEDLYHMAKKSFDNVVLQNQLRRQHALEVIEKIEQLPQVLWMENTKDSLAWALRVLNGEEITPQSLRKFPEETPKLELTQKEKNNSSATDSNNHTIEQTLPPDEWTEKQKKTFTWATTLLYTKNRAPIQPNSRVKRHLSPEDMATSSTEPDAKKARCSAATTISKILDGDIIVAVVDKGCSDGRISRERWQKIEARLTKIFLSILKEHPGSVPCCSIVGWYQDHVKFIACADQRSVDLFKIAIPSIGEAWPDAKVELVACNQVPSQLKARATIPAEPTEAQKILDIIQESNPQLHTSNWRVKRLDDSKAHIRTAIFAVDTESLVSLAVTGGVIKYGFTFITLCDFEVFFDENVAETLNMLDQIVIEIDSVSEQSPNSKQIPVEVDDSVPEQVDSNAQPLPGSMPETLTITLDNIKKEADLVEKDDSVDEHNLDDKKADHDIEEIDDSEHNPNDEADSVAGQDIAEQNDSIPEQETSTKAP